MQLLYVHVVCLICSVLLMIVLNVMSVKMNWLRVIVGYEREEYKVMGLFGEVSYLVCLVLTALIMVVSFVLMMKRD